MRVGVVWGVGESKIFIAILLGAVAIAMVFARGEVALSQPGPGTTAQVALFTAIDLTPDGFATARAWGASGGEQVGYGVGTGAVDRPHALLWRSNAASIVDLHPSGFVETKAFGTSSGEQAGYGYGSTTRGAPHALLWHGSAASVVDLHPSGFVQSQAFGISNGQQAGYGYGPATGGATHALLWLGNAVGVVDLHPAGFVNSQALGTSGVEQVGFGADSRVVAANGGIGTTRHAFLWRGTAASVVGLHFAQFASSEAIATSGGQQVGYGYGDGRNPYYYDPMHALLWRGSAASVVDLNPSGYEASRAFDICGNQQVGFGVMSRRAHAVLWSGSAASVVDLNVFLPPGFENAKAFGFNASGDIVGEAEGFASGWRTHAFLWKRNGSAPAGPQGPRRCDILR